MKTLLYAMIMLFVVALFGCSGGDRKNDTELKKVDIMNEKEAYQKKYTNEDFYKDGKLNPEVALEAYKDMLAHYGVPFSDFLKENLWITDFGLGDFEHVGMAGIFWVNNPDGKYLGHEIYLLPGQMIVEHKHLPTEYPAKDESWQVRHGWAYNYSIGDSTPNPPELPESQKDHITVSHFQVQHVDEILSLVELESPHFLYAGPEGVIVTEYGSYHDGNGLRFTNPDAVFEDALSAGI